MAKARKIGIKTNSVVTKFFSYKMNRYIECESLLECNFCYLLEFDKNVISYQEQPFKINLNGKTYTPDFHVLYTDGREEVYEIKEQNKLNEHIDKLEMAKEYFNKKGISYHVLTDEYLKNQINVKIQNFKFLYRFIQSPKYLETYESRIISRLEELKEVSINQFLKEFKESERLQVLPVIWHLIAIGVIETDLGKPLNNFSVIHFYVRRNP